MNSYYRLYRPITAAPFRNDGTYTEIPPCDALKPYIKCFWSSERPADGAGTEGELIIPDTCMDIIFEVNHTRNRIENRFVGINNKAFLTAGGMKGTDRRSVFGIRFYAWTAVLFSQDSMDGVQNNVFDAEQHFMAIKNCLEPLLYEITAFPSRAKEAEKILLRRLETRRQKPALEAAIAVLLTQKGNLRTAALADEIFLSRRQLERLFREYTGVSPKQLSSLIRYQYLWQDILREESFDAANAVHKYGYTDQSHLLHDFKKYHTLLPKEAKAYARKMAGNPVANLQYK